MSYNGYDEYVPPNPGQALPTIRRYRFDEGVKYSLRDGEYEIVMNEQSFWTLYESIGKVLRGELWKKVGKDEV